MKPEKKLGTRLEDIPVIEPSWLKQRIRNKAERHAQVVIDLERKYARNERSTEARITGGALFFLGFVAGNLTGFLAIFVSMLESTK